MSAQTIVWMNGQLVDANSATISVFDHGLLYGDGVFEGIRFYNKRPFRLAEHLLRLRQSACAIMLTIPYNDAELADAIDNMIAAYHEEDGYIRLVATRGKGPLGINPATCDKPQVFMITAAIQLTSAAAKQKGLKTIIASTRRMQSDMIDSRIKSLNYLNSILAKIEANHAGADEAIMLNTNGKVAEAAAENIFIVTGGILVTPPVTDGALSGITRGVVIELAKRENITTKEISLAPYDIYNADEVFLTGTGAELLPVRSVDGRVIKACPGSIFQTLNRRFETLARSV